MTRRKAPAYLSATRVKGLEQFLKEPLSAYELGDILWPGHRMSRVNGLAVVRELLLGEYIEYVDPLQQGQAGDGQDPVRYKATAKAAAVVANPPWKCRYCTLDVSGTLRKLLLFPCEGCRDVHQVCRWCRKFLIRPTGSFPYIIKVRACPGKIEIPRRPEPKKKSEQKPDEIQKEFAV